ncbi:glycosyl hydrolase family 28-related protein [Streptomyces sp. NPDC048290]|uniref:glycosyl hydrolase family 28-related protein n=1 Tax=Streptomyces sp. NPDC048290 TaxID=3155811 RepID=UPI00342687DE
MRIQVTREQAVDKIEVTGGQPSRVVDVTAGFVTSVNGRAGNVTGLAEADDVPDLNLANVRDYGAVGDGTTDDTAAVQSAIDAGGVTYFPPGIYAVGTLHARLGMVLRGLTRSAYAYPVPATQSSTLKLRTGTNGHLIVGADGINNVQISDLAFDGNKANNTSGDIVHIDAASAQDTSWHLYDCYLDNSPHDGIFIGSGRQAVKITRTWVMRSGNNGVTLSGADGGLDAVLIGLSGSNGVYIGGSVEHLSNCDIWSSDGNGIICDNVNQVSLVNCGIDRHKQAGLVVQGGGAVTVVGCMFHSNSQQTNNTYPHISATGGAVTVLATQFGYDGLPNNPDWAIKPVGSAAVLDWGNRVLASSTVQGYISNPAAVQNASGGSISLPTGTQVNIGGSGSSAAVAMRGSATGDFAFSTRVGSDTSSRFTLNAAGTHTWGSGTAATDITLARDIANRLTLSTADLRIATSGRGLLVAEGTNAKMGTATLNGTTSVTVTTTAVTATSRIYLTTQAPGGTPGSPYVFSRTAGTSFTIRSTSASDTGSVAWLIVEPA